MIYYLKVYEIRSLLLVYGKVHKLTLACYGSINPT